jgi:hypothetical protein
MILPWPIFLIILYLAIVPLPEVGAPVPLSITLIDDTDDCDDIDEPATDDREVIDVVLLDGDSDPYPPPGPLEWAIATVAAAAAAVC